MKRLFASAAVLAAALLASSAAQAQYTIDYGGRTIRIDPDRGTVSIPGVYDNTGRQNRRPNSDRDYERPRKQAPAQTRADPQAVPSTPANQPPAATGVPANAPLTPSNSQANVASPDTAAPAAAATPPAPPAQQDATQAAPPAPPPAVATTPSTPAPATAAVPPPAPAQQQQAARTTAPAAAAPASANSPLGLWLTEEKEGKVRIEQCGANLCGYSVDAKSNQNGEQVLINMKPGNDAKWSGRILDPNTGSTYDSTLAMKGSDTLRVQGCAFSGMFCGGQTWTRLN
jgi:uncharacterized protein (DUF2147 family)